VALCKQAAKHKMFIEFYSFRDLYYRKRPNLKSAHGYPHIQTQIFWALPKKSKFGPLFLAPVLGFPKRYVTPL
jgi:hypothetical protein